MSFSSGAHMTVLRDAGVGFDRAVLSGGGSRSPYWPQIFADCLGVPISIAEARETGALGAAIGAALATGQVSSYEEGLKRMTRIRQTFVPRAEMAAHYAERYQIYLSLVGAMRSFWQTQHAVRSTAGH